LKVTEGDHSFYVRITDAKKSVAGGPLEPVALKFDSSGIDKQFADFDIDGDGIGDRDDYDDDGDGILDEIEIQQGTNPLKEDTDGDGFKDNEDAYPLQAGNAIEDESGSINEKTENEVYKDVVVKTLGFIDNLAYSLKKKVESKQEELSEEIEETNIASGENVIVEPSYANIFSSSVEKIVKGENITQNAFLAALSAVTFALENKFILYSVVSIVLFLVLRCIIRFFRKPR